MAERTTVRLPPDLISRAKRKAAAEGRSLTALIEDGLRRVVDESRLSEPVQRVLPPVCTATGGLMPGIDIDDSSALQEMDDLEYGSPDPRRRQRTNPCLPHGHFEPRGM